MPKIATRHVERRIDSGRAFYTSESTGALVDGRPACERETARLWIPPGPLRKDNAGVAILCTLEAGHGGTCCNEFVKEAPHAR